MHLGCAGFFVGFNQFGIDTHIADWSALYERLITRARLLLSVIRKILWGPIRWDHLEHNIGLCTCNVELDPKASPTPLPLLPLDDARYRWRRLYWPNRPMNYSYVLLVVTLTLSDLLII